MHYDPRTEQHLHSTEQLLLCTGPRPLAWLSSVDTSGNLDLSLHTQWHWLSTQTPMLVFSAEQSAGSQRATTVVNAESTGWFVWNMLTPELREAALRSLDKRESGSDAFQHAGVIKSPSTTAVCPRVAQSPAHLECRYVSTQRLPGQQQGSYIDIILAEVTRVHITEGLLDHQDRSEHTALMQLTNTELVEMHKAQLSDQQDQNRDSR